MVSAYTKMPTLAQWQRDSSVALARRDRDTVLSYIDSLLDLYELDAPEFQENTDNEKGYLRSELTGDLYFALDLWLKEFRSATGMDARREPAIRVLYVFVVGELCRIFQCTVNLLPMYLERYYGKSLSLHGIEVDEVKNTADYKTRAEAQAYRLRYRDGLFMRLRAGHWVPAHTADPDIANNTVVEQGEMRAAFFVASMSQDVFMTRHEVTAGTKHHSSFFHSSYLSGETVLCAGSMQIDHGVLKRIKLDSGHYQPEASHVTMLLRSFQSRGVDLNGVTIWEHDGRSAGEVGTLAGYYMSNGGSWGELLARGQRNLLIRDGINASHAEREALIVRLWRSGLKSGAWTNDNDGITQFVGDFLLNYETGGINPRPLADLDSYYVLRAIGRERTARRVEVNEIFLQEWDAFSAAPKPRGVSDLRMAFAVMMKMKRPRAFNRWSDENIARHLTRLLAQRQGQAG